MEQRLTELMQKLHAEAMGAIPTLSKRVDTMQASLDTLQTSVDTQQTNVATLQTNVATQQTNVRVLRAASANDRIRLNNSMKSNLARLQPFAYDRDGNAWPAGVAQPETLLDLAVGGSEAKPGFSGSGGRSTWSKEKSSAFLRTACDGYESDASDADGESRHKARTGRVKVIQAVGGNLAGVFSTQYKLSLGASVGITGG